MVASLLCRWAAQLAPVPDTPSLLVAHKLAIRHARLLANPILCAQRSPLGLGRYALQATPESVWRRKPLAFPPTQSCAANVHTWASAVTPCKPLPKQSGAGSRSTSRQLNPVRPTFTLGPRPLRLASHARSSLAPEAARLPANGSLLCTLLAPCADADAQRTYPQWTWKDALSAICQVWSRSAHYASAGFTGTAWTL